MPNVVEEHKLILADIGVNSNKFWQGKRYDDNSVYTEWGRVGDKGQNQTKVFGDPGQAERYLTTKRKEKERKGYSVQRTVGSAPVKVDAASLVDAGEDDDATKKLLDYLVRANIHQITTHTNITFDVGTGTFQTPLGIVTADGIADAETLLAQISGYVEKGDWQSRWLAQAINDYMRIVPQVIGRRKPEPQQLYPDLNAVKAQQQILDSLKASLQTLQAKPTDGAQMFHRARLTTVPHDGGAGTATFKRILKKYLESRNDKHVAAKLKLLRVYEIEILGMSAAFESDGAKMQNIWELWHGTRAANLLSIMNAGFVIPKSGGSIAVTGRMFGDGVYFSDQSTKSLNYSAGYWGGGKADHCFMLLNDVAMGRFFTPSGSFSGGCRPGYDSTFAKAGKSGVMNNEMITYRTGQIKPKYLCEFGS